MKSALLHVRLRGVKPGSSTSLQLLKGPHLSVRAGGEGSVRCFKCKIRGGGLPKGEAPLEGSEVLLQKEERPHPLLSRWWHLRMLKVRFLISKEKGVEEAAPPSSALGSDEGSPTPRTCTGACTVLKAHL